MGSFMHLIAGIAHKLGLLAMLVAYAWGAALAVGAQHPARGFNLGRLGLQRLRPFDSLPADNALDLLNGAGLGLTQGTAHLPGSALAQCFVSAHR